MQDLYTDGENRKMHFLIPGDRLISMPCFSHFANLSWIVYVLMFTRVACWFNNIAFTKVQSRTVMRRDFRCEKSGMEPDGTRCSNLRGRWDSLNGGDIGD